MPGVLLYVDDLRRIMKFLSDAELREFLEMACDYVEYGEEPESTNSNAVFAFGVIQGKIDREYQKYRLKQEKEEGGAQ